jgi:hypothetical protein
MLEQDNHMAHFPQLRAPTVVSILVTEFLILLLSAGLLYYGHWVEALIAQIFYIATLAIAYVRRA